MKTISIVDFVDGAENDSLFVNSQGVYVIVNKLTRRAYVGQTSNFKSRCALHKSLLRSGRHHSRHLQEEWDRFGSDVFVFSLLHETEFINERIAIEWRCITILARMNKWLGAEKHDFHMYRLFGTSPSEDTNVYVSDAEMKEFACDHAVELVIAGANVSETAAKVGISPSTLYRALKRIRERKQTA